jgi:FKBP-type peptidyl-prolyl cis-trans isomerase
VIDYTGYLSNGQIFDATHAIGKNNNLVFKLGDRAVIPGLEDVVSSMYVGDTVQAIIPPGLGYGKRGVCIEQEGKEEECLIKPDSTLVYDVLLKKVSIPPP